MSAKQSAQTAPRTDAEVRQAALDTRRNIILEAPAGSGKTALLTARFLALLAKVSHPRQILAVTFTRKAATEMAERIAHTLQLARENKRADSLQPWEEQLLQLARAALEKHPQWDQLLRNPETLLVDTFHGFCARIARNWPLESGITPGLPLLDDVNQGALLQAAVAQYLQALNSQQASPDEREAFQRQLVAANGSLPVIVARLADLLARRDRLREFIKLFAQTQQPQKDLEKRLQALLALYLQPLSNYFRKHESSWNSLRQYLLDSGLAYAAKLREQVPDTALDDLPAWQAAAKVFLTTRGTPRQSFKSKDFGPGFSKNSLSSFIKHLPEPTAAALRLAHSLALPSEDNLGFEALRDQIILAGGLLQQFNLLLNSRGLDFMELELAALRALSSSQPNQLPSESLIFFHEHLRHVLVDEAQDMNDTQVQILSALTEGWETADGRSIFLVGDPKQSIFRFRRAEVSLFASLVKYGLPRPGEAALKLEPLHLSANFRSRPSLVAFANHAFERIMAEPVEDFDEVAFQAGQARRAEPSAAAPVTLALFAYEKDNRALPANASAARQQEALYVAAAVAEQYRATPQASLAILLPVRTHLSFYITALTDLGMPVRLMEGVPMRERFEVRHLLNLLRALLRPQDDVAWAGVMRAPWCRLPLSQLEQLKPEQGSFWSAKILAAKPDLHQDLERWQKVYQALQSDCGREPYAATLQRFWEALDGPAAIAQLAGAAGVSNSLRFLDLLDQCPQGRGAETLAALERLLQNTYTPPDPCAAFSPITMLTIHKAKGLEFDHVFSVGLDYDPRTRQPRGAQKAAFLMDRLPGKERSYLAAGATDRTTSKPFLAHTLLNDLDKNRQIAEYKRLCYVAVTRARESLTLSGILPANKKSDSAVSAIAWMAALAQSPQIGALVKTISNPSPPAGPLAAAATQKPSLSLPEPAPFEPQVLPYLMSSPSEIEDETAMVARAGAEESNDEARARGVVMHRLFDSLARNQPWPATEALQAALAAEGLPAKSLARIAADILEESRQAWDYEPFAQLRAAATAMMPEWALEDCSAAQTIRAGRIDLLLQTASGVYLVDFKTGKPNANREAWLQQEIRRYRAQVTAYAEMAAKLLAPAQPRPVIFFTAIPRWEEINLKIDPQ